MRTLLYSSQTYDRDSFLAAKAPADIDLHFQPARLTLDTVALATRHLINETSLSRMQRGAMLINTGRGALVDTPALIDALKSGQLGYLGLDVYEEEAQLFFEDRSDLPLQDDVLARLLTFPNVVITAHQAFLTREALGAIAQTTLDNIAAWAAGNPQNSV
jgi:D-lactate dehydrogenase